MLAPRRGHLLRASLLVLGLALLLTPAHLRPASAATDGKLLLVLDSSGSMQDKTDGGTKIAVAKRALNAVVDHLPADAQVGLRVYGADVDDENDPAACTDSELVVPIGPADKPALKDQIARYRPLGETPISYSLEQAAKDLGGSGRRTVVLVSDGKESCGADRCVTAANLAERGIDLKFDVIGLAVTGAVRDQLKCVADRGRGTYFDADDARQIQDSLDQLATRAFRPFQLTGTPVRGSKDQATAPTVGPGQYLDRLPSRTQHDIFYRVPRTQPGSTIHVGATARSTANGSAVTVWVKAPDGSLCGWGPGQAYQGLASGSATSWKADEDDPCSTADHLMVSVDVPSGPLVGAPFELVVVEEPALVDDRDLPPVEKPRWQPMPESAVVPAPVPGLSLSDAPVVGPGSYRASILTGETQVFAVDLAWGQRLQVQTVVAPRRGASARALGGGDYLSIGLLGPVRGAYTIVRADDQPRDTDFDVDARPVVRSATTPEVRYLNRTDFASRPADLPGQEYVVVSMNRFAHDTAFLVPYTLTIAVVGTAGEGAPEYVGATSSAPSPSPSASPSTSPAPPGSTTGLSVGAVVGIAASALLLGVAGTGAVLALRRRRRDRAALRLP